MCLPARIALFAALLTVIGGCSSGDDDAAARAAPAPAAGLFAAPVSTEVRRDSQRLVAGDLDGDGRAEVVIAKKMAGAVGRGDDQDSNGLLRWTGTGFEAASLDGGGEVMTIADLDGDGASDLIAGDRIERLSIYRNRGADGLAEPVPVSPDGSGLVHVAAVDLDADEDLDLVTVKESAEDVSVLINDGAGGFGAPSRAPIRVTGLSRAAAVDLTGDGSADLVLGGYKGLFLARNDGSGRFGKAVSLAAYEDYEPSASVRAADLNGDGHLDLIASRTGVLLIRHGDGQGGFGDDLSVLLPQGAGGTFAAGDLNGDAVVDLVMPGERNRGLGVALGKGDGTFADAVPTDYLGPVPDVAIADVDGDCAPDLVVGDHDKHVTVLLSTREQPCPAVDPADIPPGAFPDAAGLAVVLPGGRTFAAPVLTPTGRDAIEPLVVDVNADGHDDLVVNGWYQRRITIRLGKADGHFGAARHVPVPALAQPPSEPCNDTGTVIGGRGTSAGSGPRTTLPMACTARDDIPSGLTVVDLTGDGHVDLVMGTSFGRSVAVLRGNGKGDFEPQRRYRVPGDKYSSVRAIKTGDLDGDGDVDVLAGNRLMLNDGRGALFFATAIAAKGGLEPGDLDGDGDLDLVQLVTAGRHDRMTMWTNDGRARFTQGKPVDVRIDGTTGNLANLTLHDVDGDGRLDVVLTAPVRRKVVVFYGDGRAGFAAPLALDTGGGEPSAVAVGDVTGDGAQDLVVANIAATEVVVLAAEGRRAFTDRARVPVELGPNAVFLRDIDGDHVLDVVTFHSKPRQAAVRFTRPGAHR